MIQYRRAKYEELKSIARLITDSFKEYPFFDLLLPPGKKNDDFLFSLHYLNTMTYLKKHCCFIGIEDGQILTAVLLKHRDKPEVGFFDYVSSEGFNLLINGGIPCIKNLLKMTHKSKLACHGLGKSNWYLEALVVNVNFQSRHLGSHMLRKCVFPYIKFNGGGVLTLITSTEKNRIFYTKNGFEEFDETFLTNYNCRVGNWSFKIKL